jgi:hypothetical protein
MRKKLSIEQRGAAIKAAAMELLKEQLGVVYKEDLDRLTPEQDEAARHFAQVTSDFINADAAMQRKPSLENAYALLKAGRRPL